MIKEERSIIVIADTHLGLRPSSLNPFGLRNTHSCQPAILSEFLNWLRKLEEVGSFKIRLNADEEKLLLPPSELILLGDIIELWDASDRSIEFNSRDFNNAISKLKCEKIYLLGNHDDILEELTGLLPSGSSTIKIIKGIYPEQEDSPEHNRKLSCKRIGEKNYLFLHGHQFDSTFRLVGPFWKFLGYLRDGAEAFGLFTWILVGFFLMYPLLFKILKLPVNLVFLLLLGVLALPRIISSIARPIYNKLFGKRYKPWDIIEPFYNFWIDFTKNIDYPSDVTLVFGHTHTPWIFTHKDVEKKVRRDDWKVKATLLNLSSWVIDEKEWHKEVSSENPFGHLLYIDEEGWYLLKWDWYNRKLIYISPEEIRYEGLEFDIPRANENY